ncbi:8610_t:CDS:2 [Entrophospora sp. SA101]|nr:8610_t:CDS:2 [Entrophospora sp. SA101]CAJ0904834.1 4024_t:CDS:2 [Entrophospora sp. SA101]CAJ0912163.1 20667_t:CDS:2 [Entrophospora sp. SA101]
MDENKVQPLHVTGILLYRIQRHIEFLLLNDTFSNKRHWTAPKGRVIRQEDEVKCALRNTIEITGLSVKDIRIEEGFRAEITYLSETRPKRVVYYLAQVTDHDRIYSNAGEGLNFAWLQLYNATEKVLYKSMQDVIKKAHAFIEANKPSKKYDSSTLQQWSIRNDKKNNTADRIESNLKNLNMALPLESQRHAISRQRFEHVRENLSQLDNPLYKTRLCERFETEKFCPYGPKCTFAHGAGELRERLVVPVEEKSSLPTVKDGPENPLYKTRLCERFMKENFCQYGPKCNFAHVGPSSPGLNMGSGSGGYRSEIQNGIFAKINTLSSPLTPTSTQNNLTNNNSSQTEVQQDSEEYTVEGGDIEKKKDNGQINISSETKTVSTGVGSVIVTNTSTNTNEDFRNLFKPNKNDLVDEKPWIEVVELTNMEIEQLGKIKKTDHNVTNVDKKSQEEVLILELKKFFVQSKEQNKTILEEIKEVTLMETRKDLSKLQLFNILLPSLYDDATWDDIIKDLDLKKKLFKTFICSAQDQIIFIRAWEKFLNQRNKKWVKQSPMLYKTFYDKDYVDEDSIYKWYESAKDTSDVKKKCKVFVDWLKNAEEED